MNLVAALFTGLTGKNIAREIAERASGLTT